jgi:bifunctional ADP-heptose synthase (sugar kinase/adenylyltransferase)
LSPEAPVPVFLPIRKTTNHGMAGNVVQNLLAMKPELDIIFEHQVRPIKKTRYVDDKTNHMFLRVDDGDVSEPIHLFDEFLYNLGLSDAVIISDYDKGFLTQERIQIISSYSKFTVLDSKKRLPNSVFEAVDFIKLNEKEFRSNKIEERYLPKVLITRGIDGTDYMGKNYPSTGPINTMDVSGAGDTFTAAFTLKYLETKDIELSITFANEMARKVVSKRGVATP